MWKLTHWKILWCWEGLGAGGKGEDKMPGWHHRLDGREFEWTPGVGDVQGGPACCDSWGHKESDMTEQPNWTEMNWGLLPWKEPIYLDGINKYSGYECAFPDQRHLASTMDKCLIHWHGILQNILSEQHIHSMANEGSQGHTSMRLTQPIIILQNCQLGRARI